MEASDSEVREGGGGLLLGYFSIVGLIFGPKNRGPAAPGPFLRRITVGSPKKSKLYLPLKVKSANSPMIVGMNKKVVEFELTPVD